MVLRIQKFTVVAFLAVYFLTAGMLFDHIRLMENGSRMNHSENCTYITGKYAICPTGTFAQNIFWDEAIIKSPVLFWGIFFILLTSTLLLLYIKIVKEYLFIKSQRFKGGYNLYTGLFSRGILNSKAY